MGERQVVRVSGRRQLTVVMKDEGQTIKIFFKKCGGRGRHKSLTISID